MIVRGKLGTQTRTPSEGARVPPKWPGSLLSPQDGPRSAGPRTPACCPAPMHRATPSQWAGHPHTTSTVPERGRLCAVHHEQ